ncbi:hypothetical protein IP70_20460 [alpha proteobacterium AAP38]|nr:hypothetical protein IP70_20460 [alpha proteobacterium AAP38]
MRNFMASIFKGLFGGGGQTPETVVQPRPRYQRPRPSMPLAPTEPAADALPPPPPDMADGHDPELSAKLRRIFDRRDPTQAGSIHLLGLGSLHEQLGSRWPAVAARVHQLTAKLLDQHLTPHDAWFRHGEEAYVVVFAQLGAEQACLICAKVMEELQLVLLGHADTENIRVHTAMREIGSDVLLVPTSLKDMLSAVRKEAVADAALAGPIAVRSEGFRASLLARAGPSQVRYRPVWDVQKQVLSLYMARCCRERAGRTPLWGYDCLDDPEDMAGILALDLHVAREAIETSLELYENRFRFFLSLPLHFESLAVTARRQEVMAVLRTIPRNLLPFITFHLWAVPDGVPTGRLSELVSALKPFGRTVMMEVASPTSDVSVAEAAGIRVVNLTLPSGASVERWAPEVVRFATQAARHRLMPAVEGVDSLAMEDQCEEAGVRFLSGDLIGGWVDVPEHVVRRSRTDFVRQGVNLRGGLSD